MLYLKVIHDLSGCVWAISPSDANKEGYHGDYVEECNFFGAKDMAKDLFRQEIWEYKTFDFPTIINHLLTCGWEVEQAEKYWGSSILSEKRGDIPRQQKWLEDLADYVNGWEPTSQHLLIIETAKALDHGEEGSGPMLWDLLQDAGLENTDLGMMCHHLAQNEGSPFIAFVLYLWGKAAEGSREVFGALTLSIDEVRAKSYRREPLPAFTILNEILTVVENVIEEDEDKAYAWSRCHAIFAR